MGFYGPILKRLRNKLINLETLPYFERLLLLSFSKTEKKKLQSMVSFIFFLHFRKGAMVENKPPTIKKMSVDVAILSVGQATKTIKRLLGDALLFFELVGETRWNRRLWLGCNAH